MNSNNQESYWSRPGGRKTANSGGGIQDLLSSTLHHTDQTGNGFGQVNRQTEVTQESERSSITTVTTNTDSSNLLHPPIGIAKPPIRQRWITNQNSTATNNTFPTSEDQLQMNSTPATSPRFLERRSPATLVDDDDTSNKSGYGNFKTPLLQVDRETALSNNSDIVILPDNPNLSDVALMIKYVSDKVEDFGSDFRTKEGWKSKLEATADGMRKEIDELANACKLMLYLDELQKVYTITNTLGKHLKALRILAKKEAEETGSPFPFREPSLHLPSPAQQPTEKSFHDVINEEIAGCRSKPTTHSDISDIEEKDKSESESQIRSGNIHSFHQAIQQLKKQIFNLESKKVDKNIFSTEIQRIDTTKCSKSDLSQACMRISHNELEMKRIRELKLFDSISENWRNIVTNTTSCQKLEDLFKGLCGDNLTLQKKLDSAIRRIDTLEETLPNAYGDETSHLDIQSRSKPMKQVQLASQTHQPPTVSRTSQLNQAVTGISHLSTSTSNYFLDVINRGGTQLTSTNSANIVTSTILPNATSTIRQQSRRTPQSGTLLRRPEDQEQEPYHRVRNSNLMQYEQEANLEVGSNQSNVSKEDDLSRAGFKLKCAGKNLDKMLKPPVNDRLTKTTVQGILKNLVPAVESERKEVQQLLYSYEREPDPCPILIADTDALIHDSKTWARGMRDKYLELDCSKGPLDHKLYDTLKRFHDNSEINIFEFLEKFEAYTEEKGTARERAIMLYEQYLSKEIQMMLVERKDDYQLMRTWLITRFGDVKIMTENILKTLSRETIPSDDSPSLTKANYFRKLNAAIKRVKELGKTADMPLRNLEAHIYSNDFMTKLLSFVPEKPKFELFQELMKAGDCAEVRQIEGKEAFNKLSCIVYFHLCTHEGICKVDNSNNLGKTQKPERIHKEVSPKNRKKGAHTVRSAEMCLSDDHSSTESDDDTQRTVHFSKDVPKKKEREKRTDKRPDKKQDSTFNFPCCLRDHSHEIGECATFFKMAPRTRMRAATGRTCFSCLGPFSKCKPKCSIVMPDELLCPECKEWAEQNDKAPQSILFCINKEHTKPSVNTLTSLLQKHLKNYKPTINNGDVRLVAHLNIAVHSSKCTACKNQDCHCQKMSLSSKEDPLTEIPAIDTSTGETVNPASNQIVKESEEEAFYVMQILSIRGQDALTFYDRGANYHLIDGQMAEDVGLKVLKREGVNIGVVGGGSIWSQYGTYGLMLGPTEDGYYHQISAQGVGKITQKFPMYDLEGINREVKKSKHFDNSEVLPKYIGGMTPRILVGIKDTGLEPVLMFQLPCGLGIYKSPLKDKFGSRICYGGPHNIFSKVKGTTASHIGIFFSNAISQYMQSPYPSLARCLEPELEETDIGIMLVKDSRPSCKITTTDPIDLYPSAITETDIAEMGVLENEPIELQPAHCASHPIYDLSHSHTSGIQSHKAKVPISKRKEYIDAEDQCLAGSFRCESCAKCPKCSLSDKTKMMSLQERMEQEAIRESVHLDLPNQKVYVDLPFTKPPVQALKKRHHGADSNYMQALKIYQTQCRKNTYVKEQIVKAHDDLVNQGFMKKIDELTPEQQSIIKTAGFKHYMPWRTAEKPESLSTPYRLVVDASITGLNEILAKGENKMTKMNHILIRNRCRNFVWSSDISKLYNQLHLNNTALPYGLFLFQSKLDPSTKPDIYCMTVAWYGVSPTGNQSAEALEQLTQAHKEEYPLPVEIVRKDLYVDDTWTGHNDQSIANKQLEEMQSVLANGGFKLKYVVKSGQAPCKESSSNGEDLKILGYKWTPLKDNISPGLGEINFNKRRAGSKKPNKFPVVTSADLRVLLDSTMITRRMVASKLAEFYDPVGLWEPFKVQLKLDNQELHGLDWDTVLSDELQMQWKARFQQFLEIPRMMAPRCVIPSDAIDPTSIRLLCVSDAAENAGGCAIYAGYLRANQQYSCQLLTSRSKLMNQKIPRNELEGIKLMAETAEMVKTALGPWVSEVLYFTDSTIAMCWCHNTSKKLRLFTLYRVAEIRRLILGSVCTDEDKPLPLYHIDGKLNTADLLTKYHNITPETLGPDSNWQRGYPWMELPLDQMSITRYDQISYSQDEIDSIDIECFPSPILSDNTTTVHLSRQHSKHLSEVHCQGCVMLDPVIPELVCYGSSDEFDHCDSCECKVQFTSFALGIERGPSVLINPIELGWTRCVSRLSYMLAFASKAKHQAHLKMKIKNKEDCKMCEIPEAVIADSIELDKQFLKMAKDQLFRQESTRIKKLLPQKKLDSFIEKNGILYYESRLSEEHPVTQTDLGFGVFFDNTEISTMLPVVLADSELFFSYIMHVHHYVLPHSGVEATLREVSKQMMVLNNPRRIILRVRKDCPRCRIIAKKTRELRMMHHPSARTELAPPFYHCQMDTVFGFKGKPYKNARKTFKTYALVIVCLLTGATNILALEGLETQDVVQALERHAFRHGMPSAVYVDNGTQLTALDHVSFSIRDLQSKVKDSYGMKIIVSNPKSHEERGRVEARVKILRVMLEKLTVKTDHGMTALQWETLFSKISNMINDLPIAKSSTSNVSDLGWDIITPNRLQLGRNNNRSLEGWIDLSKGVGSEALLRRNQEIQKLWYQMFLDKIHHLIPRPSKWTKTDPINIGDICLFTFNENPGLNKDTWKIGKVKDKPKENSILISYPGKLSTNGLYEMKVITRSPRNISIISATNEIDLNSREYFNRIRDTPTECATSIQKA